MDRRAEQVEETRHRIVEATVELHAERGPAGTSIAAIAERAGVTRLTVYRHFPDDTALFTACSGHWAAQQAPPDVAAWGRIADDGERLQRGLADLYRYYREGEPMLTGVHRDRAVLPEAIRQMLAEEEQAYRQTLLPSARGRAAALLGHAVSFPTWLSLCREQRLPDRAAAEEMARLVLGC